jgi:hypothetical protein
MEGRIGGGIIIDKTSLLCGPIRSIALVLALTNGNKLKHRIAHLLKLLLTNIQFGHNVASSYGLGRNRTYTTLFELKYLFL